MFDEKNVFRIELNSARDPLAVLWTKEEDSKNKEVQCSLQERDTGFFIAGHTLG